MENTILTITTAPGMAPDTSDLEKELRNLLGDDSIHRTESKSFAGWTEIILILSIGGGVAIKEIGAIIRSWIERNKGKKANLDKLEFTGYSAKELKAIIQTDRQDRN